MKTSDIIEIIYNYYPKLVKGNELNTDSSEYLNRVKKCEEARNNQINWSNFKIELTEYALSQYNDGLDDYSILGSTPCYSATIGFGKYSNKNSWMLSVSVSVIIPLWSYRIIDFDAPGTARYEGLYAHEDHLIEFLELLIKKYFTGYEFINKEQSQIVIPDIATAFKTSPTIFDALFKEDLN